MILHGVIPQKKDHRTFSFHRTAIACGATTPEFPDTLSVDAGLWMPDQNADGFPYACTAYSTCDLSVNVDRILKQPSFSYAKTLFMEGKTGQVVGCLQTDALKSSIVYGLLAVGETTDVQALNHRRGQYFDAVDGSQLDAFDSIRSAIVLNTQNKEAVSIISPWFREFDQVDGTGIVGDTFAYNGVPSAYNWHNYVCPGWVTLNDQPYLQIKSWQGRDMGDKGWLYFSRPMFNKLATIPGFAAKIQTTFDKTDIKTIELTLVETILSYMRLLASKF